MANGACVEFQGPPTYPCWRCGRPKERHEVEGRVPSRRFVWRFRSGGIVHRLWLWWYGRPMWPWRWLCWLDRNHEPWGNGRKDYCLTCGALMIYDRIDKTWRAA